MTEAVLDSPASDPQVSASEIASRIASSQVALAALRRKQRWSRFIKLVRRSHLYAGLFMTPWVFLYGITAFLFNHPSIFSDQTIIPLNGDSNAAAIAASIPDASEIAAETVTRINSLAKTEYRLDKSAMPRFSRPLTIAMTDGKSQFQLTYDLENRTGTVRITPVRAFSNTPPARSNTGLPARIPFPGFESEKMTSELESVLASSGIETTGLKQADPISGVSSEGADSPERKSRNRGGESGSEKQGDRGDSFRKQGGPGGASGQGRTGTFLAAGQPQQPAGGGRTLPQGPEVAFVMIDPSGERNEVNYNLRSGTLDVHKAGESRAGSGASAPLSTRRYFLRLHTAHGYPDSFGSRWVWAMIVDVMFVCMVGWAVTGIVMWHQMKHLRRIGWVVLAASLVASVAVAIGMHGEMVAAGR